MAPLKGHCRTYKQPRDLEMTSSDENSRDRRNAERVEYAARCWCESPGLTQYVHVANVSEGGMFVRTLTPFHVGEKLMVRWTLPDVPLELEAATQVVWKCEGQRNRDGCPGMGLKFLSLDRLASEALDRFINSTGCGKA